MKNQKGITLVALVVTIIVLLILAGVSLSLVAGSNGIMQRATNAVSVNESATGAEQAELRLIDLQTEYYEKYYVEEDSSVMGITMTQYIEENGSSLCSNSRYYLEVANGTVNVYVGSKTEGATASDNTGTKVATRKYDNSSSATTFQWTDSKWTHVSSNRNAQ